MTVNQFITKYTNKGIDFDGSFGNQCMDLYRQYVKEVLSFPQSPAVPGAKDVWDTYLTDRFTKISNTPTNTPKNGDVVIWGTKIGQFGHIAIFVDGTATKFNSFDQNFPIGSLCHIQSHTYNGVLGWLRPRSVTMNEVANWVSQMFQGLGIDLNKPEGEVRGKVQEVIDGWKRYVDLEQKVARLEKDLSFEAGQAAEFEKRLILSESSQKDLLEALSDARDQITTRDTEVSNLTQRIVALEKTIDPETKVVISKDEYARLTDPEPLRRFGAGRLLAEALKRIVGR